MTRVAIAGATGKVGLALLPLLDEAGLDARALVRDETPRQSPSAFMQTVGDHLPTLISTRRHRRAAGPTVHCARVRPRSPRLVTADDLKG